MKGRAPPKCFNSRIRTFQESEMLLIFHSIARIKNMSMVEKETINTPAVLDSGRLRCLRRPTLTFSKSL